MKGINSAMVQKPKSQGRWSKLRLGAADTLLGLSILVPVLSTTRMGSLAVIDLTIWLLLSFVLVMLPESIPEMRRIAHSRLFRIAGVVFLFCVAAWVAHQGLQFSTIRITVPLVFILFFASAVAWFRDSGARRIAAVFWLKVALTAAAVVLIGVSLSGGASLKETFVNPPIYRHLRHLNYDLAIVIGMALYFFRGYERRFRWPAVLGFVALGYVSFWTGGRGEFVSLLAMLIILIAVGRVSVKSPIVIVPAASVLLGGLLVLFLGQDDLLLDRIGRSVNGTVNAISSGRLRIWSVTMDRALESPYSALFGFGPDAFARLGIYRAVGHYILHPHNTVVQWVLEYGLVGATVLLAVVWQIVRTALAFIRRPGMSEEKAIAITTIGMLVFGLVDGVYYHAAPLTFMVMLWAYLYAFRSSTTRNENAGL